MFIVILVVLGLLSPGFCQNTALDKLIEKVDYLEKELALTRGRTDSLEKVTGDLQTDVSELKESNNQFTGVAFLVWRNGQVTINAGGKIQYNTVLTNAGSGWSPTAYEFVAPSDGAYVFYWNIHLSSGGFGRYDLYRNDVLYVLARADQNNEAMADNMGVVLLSAGDRMSIKAERQATLNGSGYCTFSGFKLA